jgi:glycosyltransferase involved in cell wall biosynthesis
MMKRLGELPELTMRARTGVVIPTRNRPEHLERCLDALAAAHEQHAFTAWVCDSSDERRKGEIERICAAHPWVELRFHQGGTISAARNFCAQVAEAELLVSVDDDVIVEPQTVKALVEAYDRATGPRVVAGAVVWGAGSPPTAPMVLRRIGYARSAGDGEAPDFLNSSLFLYPRAYALSWPWSERIRRGSDVLMGAIWRAAGVQMLWAPQALALHEERDVLTVEQHGDYVYAVLAHILLADKRPLRLALLETVGVAAGVKGYGRTPRALGAYLRAWVRGHRAFARDFRSLQEFASRPAPPAPVASRVG